MQKGGGAMKHIAVVEDEALMREELADMLRRAGYTVTEVTDFADVTGQLLALAPDLVLLDLNLPEVSGFQICRDIKQRSALPVLVLTSRDQLRDEVHALELGADEYLTKPYRKERLLARIGNVLKRYEGRPNLLEGADFLLDRQTYTLYIHNQSVVLPPNQGKLLETLLAHGGQTVAKDDLSRALWGTTEFIDENALQVNLTRLKKTMASLGMRQQLVSVRGVGYRFERLALRSCIDEVLEDYRPLLEEKHFRVEFRLADETVFSDRRELCFLLGQVVSNSVKYALDAPVLTFSLENGGTATVLSIRDNGPGVRACDLPYVFEKGFTGDSGHEKNKATGMGLYLAREVAKDLGLTLTAASDWGAGFAVRVTFPVVEE